jgi:hypothetical protein
MDAPSYMKRFFILFVFGLGKRMVRELLRRLRFNISFLKENNSLSQFGPMLLSVLNIIFAFAFTFCSLSGSHPNIFSRVC